MAAGKQADKADGRSRGEGRSAVFSGPWAPRKSKQLSKGSRELTPNPILSQVLNHSTLTRTPGLLGESKQYEATLAGEWEKQSPLQLIFIEKGVKSGLRLSVLSASCSLRCCSSPFGTTAPSFPISVPIPACAGDSCERRNKGNPEARGES